MKSLPVFIEKCGSLAEAARRLDVHVTTLDRWRRGTCKPSRAMIHLAELQDVDLIADRITPTRHLTR